MAGEPQTWLSKHMAVILTGAAMGVSVVAYVSRTDAQMIERHQFIATQVTEMRTALHEMQRQNISYRITVTESDVKVLGQRIDRLSETLATQLEGLRKDMNAMAMKTELVGQQMHALVQKLELIIPDRRATKPATEKAN